MIKIIENSGSDFNSSACLSGLVEDIFEAGGFLESELGLSHRQEQATMAKSVAASLESNQPLLVEAGTGVGKSLAYLIPGIMYSIHRRCPFVISSQTISLQEQIREKDLKICRQLFLKVPELRQFGGFKTALMLGKANYCCSTRLSHAIKDLESDSQTRIFENKLAEDLMRIVNWSAVTQNGVIQELNPRPSPEVWDLVHADSSICSRKNCRADVCFYQRARRQLLSANCIILNHSLLFSLIQAGMQPDGDCPGILLPDDFVVLDEAHHIPAIATDHFGIDVSSHGIIRALRRIYNPRTRRRGLLRFNVQQQDIHAITNAITQTGVFFDYLGEHFLKEKRLQRIYEPEFCENTINEPLRKVVERLNALIEKSDNQRMHDELGDHRQRILNYCNSIHAFIGFAEDDHVQWIERRGKRGQVIALRSAPLDVAPYLRQHIFSRGTSAILTSATLFDARGIDFFQKKTGAESADSMIVGSPFDYSANCRIYIADDAPQPEPGKGRPDLDYLANMISWCVKRVEGGTLVLFTSYFDIREVQKRTQDFFESLKKPFFVQEQTTDRSRITGEFAISEKGVLFGTDSFWTGVDIPGSALSQVIIARLPFEPPGHPVSEARSEFIRDQGGNPFMELTVPEALIKFRQGMGRLIRRHEDRGNIVILDSRILNRAYGRYFINVLPVGTYQRFNLEDRESVLV